MLCLHKKCCSFQLSERLDYRDVKVMFSPTVQDFFLTPHFPQLSVRIHGILEHWFSTFISIFSQGWACELPGLFQLPLAYFWFGSGLIFWEQTDDLMVCVSWLCSLAQCQELQEKLSCLVSQKWTQPQPGWRWWPKLQPQETFHKSSLVHSNFHIN